jgi:hypothetical protein
MTTDRRLASALCIGLLSSLTSATCATTSNRRGDALDVSGYPEDLQEAYKVFAVRCSRCHTLARPLNAHITDPAHWVRYVARMRLNPASGINAKNGEVIIRFLQYYTQQREQERRARDGEAEPAAPSQDLEAAPDQPPPTAAEPQPGASETQPEAQP